jgi:ribosomal protein S18 acetylase RimI-like enzyme
MDVRLTPIAELDKPALIRLTALHCAVMHTLLADLGAPLVQHYYEAAQTDPAVLGLCAIAPDGGLLGWALGSPDPAALNKRLRQPPAWFVSQMMRLIFSRPGAFIALIRSVFSANEANKLGNGQIELTYIGVAPQAQGRGLGRAVLAAFSARAKSAGYTSIALSVETDNPAAVALYTKSGFRINQTFTEGRFRRHRMEYPLT